MRLSTSDIDNDRMRSTFPCELEPQVLLASEVLRRTRATTDGLTVRY